MRQPRVRQVESGDASTLRHIHMWRTFGWLAQAVWLVFLIFPIEAVLVSPNSGAMKAYGLAVIAAFAIAYLVATRSLDLALGRGESVSARARGWVLVQGGLMLALWPVIGLSTIGVLPFIVAFGMLLLRLPEAVVVAVVSVISSGLLAMRWHHAHSGILLLAVIVLAVTVMTGAMRLLLDRSVADQAVENQLTVVAERERVARDVHDVLGHSLTVLSVKAELAERLLDIDVERARAELVEIRDLTRTALAEVRATVGGLRVARLDDELLAARNALIDKGIESTVPGDSAVVDPRHRILFAWVLREAITNVVRHSGAQHCTVELGSNHIVVTDDGRGIGLTPAGRSPDGNGLRGLRERAAAAHARLTIDAAEPRGTRVELRV